MIDPIEVTKFDRTDVELQEWWLFSLVVAGKTAATQARLLDGFLVGLPPGESPFAQIRVTTDDELFRHMKAARLGQYGRLARAFRESSTIALDWRTCPVAALEAIYGVGPKTARMFVMHSREHDQRYAALDTHILKFLKDKGVPDVPKATPGSPIQYRRLERIFVQHAEEAGMGVADFDLHIWKRYARL
jgi:hypothetical protein